MTLEDIKQRKQELNEELEKLHKEEVKLQQEKFKDKLGKYYRFNTESIYDGYIKLEDIWGAPNYILEGMWFTANTTKARHDNCFYFEPWKQISIKNRVTSWNDFHLTEVSEEEFVRAFNKAIEEEKELFSYYIL